MQSCFRRFALFASGMVVLSLSVPAAEPAYAFRSRLEAVHEPGRRDAAAAPRADEFVFRDGCRVPTADFADYLNVSMGVRATVDAARGDVTVVLDRTLRERECTVDVGASGVAIRAYDERARDQALYHLEDLMNLRRAPFLAFGRERRRMRYSPRMTHSGWGLDKFPDAHLRQLAHQGFDAILLFLTGVDETQGGGKGAGINDIVDRALCAGLDTYLYSKVPVFAHPDNPEGARKLRETFGTIAAAHPRAKGIVFVGESAEFPSRDERTCGLSLYQERPKDETRPLPGWYPCRDYPDWLKAVQTALHEKSPGLEIVFWTYNWSDCPPEQGADLLKRFPPEVAIESTFGPGESHRYRNGLEVVARDYTLSVPGPNRHFELEAAAAAAGKRKLYAMSNTGGLTWDHGVVPYQPCPYQWKRRWDALNATDGLVGLMESHHFGCWPSFVTELAKEAFTEGGLPVEDCLRRIAARDFGEANVEDVLSVWRDWSDAAADYAATNENQYGPFRLGPAYPFNFGGKPIAEGEFPQGKGATHVMRWMAYLNYPYDKAAADSLNVTYESLSPEDRRKDLELLQTMREKWMAGATRLRRIARTLDANRRRNGERLADLGEWHARTVATAIALRRGQAAFAAGDRRALVAVAAEERRNAVAALELAERDSRLGWEPSMEYVGGPEQLRWKIALIDRLYGAEFAGGVFADGSFHVGCNYWASHAGMYMWRNWRPQTVERDFDELSGYGVNMMRVFPLWPDFQPLTRQLGGHGSDFGLLQGDGPLKNPAGVDEEMIRRFRFLCDVAAKHDVKLVVGLLTGWMSGRLFVPPAFAGRDVITDPEALEYEVKFVRHFVRALKDHPAIVAWDFGNECDCMGPANGPQSWVWLNAIGSAIRMEDPSRPVVAGMHGGSNMPREPFSLVRQGEAADVLTTHPYPLFTPECARGPFNTMRSILHPTAESLFYAGLTGRPAFVEEAGDLGRCTASEARAAGNMRAAMFSAWANGLGAYLWWCGFDQQHLDFPPYNRNAVERELGLFTKDYVAKPQLKAIREFTSFLKDFPHAALPPRRIDAVCLVSESEPAWKQALGAYLLARQAGFDLAFASAERPLPDAPLYVLPSGDGIDPYTFNAWSAVLAKVRSGATLLVSKGGETRYSGYREATGNEIDCFYQKPSSGVFAFADWPERKIAWNDAATVKVLSRESETLAETDGNPMVTAHRLGKGRVVAVNFAIESDSVTRSDCFFGEELNPRYLVYRKAAALAGISRCVRCEHPGIVVTEHRLPSGGTLCVAVNCEDRALSVPLELKGRLGRVYRGEIMGQGLKLAANDAAVFEVEREPLRIVLTFDDAHKDHLLTAAPELEKRGWRGTFNLVTDWIGLDDRFLSWGDVKELVRRGHEIATHTAGHPDLLRLLESGKTNEVRRQIAVSRDLIADRAGFAPRYLCAPFIAQNDVTDRLCREAGLRQMSVARVYDFGSDDGDRIPAIVQDALARGCRRLDFLYHGIAHPAAFARQLDRLAELERRGLVRVTDYDGCASDCALKAEAWPHHGVLALSFDDRNLPAWESAFPLFEKYRATTTFCICGEMDETAVAFARRALLRGHEIALHGLKHRNADSTIAKMGEAAYWEAEVAPQVAACRAADIPVRSFAYPNCRHDAVSDTLFARHGFTRLRGSIPGVRNPNPYDPRGEKRDQWRPIAEADAFFRPATDHLNARDVSNVILGESYHTDIEDVIRAVRRAGSRGERLSLVSHGIAPGAGDINMKTEWLERILAEADAAGVVVRGLR